MPIEPRTRSGDIANYLYKGTFSDAELDVALDDMKRRLVEARDQRKKLAFVSVSAPDSEMTSRQRSRAADWIKVENQLMLDACACQAVVVPGAVQRGVLTAILWMTTYPVPIKAFGSEDEAESWARSFTATGASARLG